METQKKERIVIVDQFSLNEWCEILNCTEQDLLKAMQEMGNLTRAVDDYLVLNRRKLASGMDL